MPRAGFDIRAPSELQVERIDLLRFMAGYCKRRLLFCLLALVYFEYVSCCSLGPLFVFRYFVFVCELSLGWCGSVVSTSASAWLERLVSEMTYGVFMGTLNPAHSLTRWLIIHTAVECWCVDSLSRTRRYSQFWRVHHRVLVLPSATSSYFHLVGLSRSIHSDLPTITVCACLLADPNSSPTTTFSLI